MTLEKFADRIARTLAASTVDLVDRRLDERLRLEREHMRELVRMELEARLPQARGADLDERRLQ